MTPLVVTFIVITTGLIAITVIVPLHAGAVLYVGGGGPGNFTTIQGAILSANPGDTIFVFNGTYHETVAVTKTVNLIGEGSNVTIVDGGGSDSVFRVLADWVNITGFTIVNAGGYPWGGAGVELNSVGRARIADNILTLNRFGILAENSTGNAFANNTVSSNDWGIYLHASSDNTIEGNLAKSSYYAGIALIVLNRAIVINNTLSGNYYGASLYAANETRLESNIVDNNTYRGLSAEESVRVTLRGNNVTNNPVDVWLVHSDFASVSDNVISGGPNFLVLAADNCRIAGNTIRNDESDDYFDSVIIHGTNNTFVENTIVGGSVRVTDSSDILFANNSLSMRPHWGVSNWGLSIYYSLNTTLEKNTMTKTGVRIDGDKISQWTSHTIASSNTVNGKPVYYWKNVVGGTIPSDAGQVILANSTGVRIANQNLSVSINGLTLGFSSGNMIVDNNISFNTWEGIELKYSDNNLIANNSMFRNDYAGLGIFSSSHNNSVVNNTISYSRYQVLEIYDSENNSFKRNTFSNSDGVNINYAENTSFVNNRFLNNLYGVNIGDSNHTKVVGNEFASNRGYGYYGNEGYAVSLWSDKTLVMDNSITDSDVGVDIFRSSNNTVYRNIFRQNAYGIYLTHSRNNTVTYNTFVDDENGTHLNCSYGNTIHHNNFFSNVNRSFDNGTNAWNDSYPAGGNYWSDYAGIDLFSGPNQDQPGGDGIGDKPYNITGGSNVDKFPLMYPAGGWPTRPSAPRSLVVQPGSSKALLNWTESLSDGGSPITSYVIYRGISSHAETYLTEIGGILNFADTGLNPAQTYYYKVAAMNIVGEGPISNEAAVIPVIKPSPPSGLMAARGDAQVRLNWTEPADNGGLPIENYRIYRGNISGGETHLVETTNVLFYNDTGLINGKTYFYQVSARSAFGEGAFSREVKATPATIPLEPQNLDATAGARSVSLTWTAPMFDGGDAISNYRIYRGTSSGSWVLAMEFGNVLSFNDTGLTNGLTYHYRVAAVNQMGEGSNSSEVSAIPVAVPGAPNALTAIGGNGQVLLNWLPPVDDGGSAVDKYRIYRGASPGSLSFLTEIGNILSFTDTSLTNGRTYYYRVTALNQAGEGLNSSVVPAIPMTTPGAPTAVDGVGGNGQVHLSWRPPIDDGGSPVNTYRIYRGMSSGSLFFLTEVGNMLTYNDAMLTNGETYYYQVSAVNAVGEGGVSNEISCTPATVPTAPWRLRVFAGDSQITLDWTVPVTDGGSEITGYRIFRGTAPGQEEDLNLTVAAPPYVDTGLANSVTYYYQVAAVNVMGEGVKSLEIHATPIPHPPPRAVIEGRIQCRTGETLSFDGGKSTGAISSFYWIIKDDRGNVMIMASGSVVNYTFMMVGSFTVTLRVTDNLTGLYSEDIVGVSVAGGPDILVLLLAGALLLACLMIWGGTEVGRVTLLTLLVAPAFHKKAKEDPDTRGMIRGYIKVHPGDSYGDIKRNLDLNSGTLTWHLMKLEKESMIKSKVRGTRRLYYLADAPWSLEDGGDLHEVQTHLLGIVRKHPGMAVGLLAEEMGISRQLALYHLRELRQRSLVSLERQGLRIKAYPPFSKPSKPRDELKSV